MNDDDIQLQSYQDDLTTDENATDPLMEEENDDPTSELGVPAEEFKEELDKEEIDDGGNLLDSNDRDILDDQSERFEDLDEDGDDDSYR